MGDDNCPACGGTLDLDGFCSECDAFADELEDLEADDDLFDADFDDNEYKEEE